MRTSRVVGLAAASILVLAACAPVEEAADAPQADVTGDAGGLPTRTEAC
jgi:hypothetical protein